MDNLKVITLTPDDSHVSFYGKAKVIERTIGRFTCKYLQSYETIVALYIDSDEYKSEFFRLWDGYSATTARHIKAFCKYCGIPAIDKATWCRLPVQDHDVDDVLQPFNWSRTSRQYGMWTW